MSHTLHRLFHQLEHGILPVESFYMYQGVDWKKHVQYTNGKHPFVTQLWKSNDFKLLLKTWQLGQYEQTSHTIHTRILKGKLSLFNQDTKETTTLFPTAKPHLVQSYRNLWTAQEPSVSLQLYHVGLF